MTDAETKLAFLSKFDEAFDSPTHSDLTIVVDDTRFHVHKVILGLRTPFFTNATRHGFSEANDNVVTIREHGVEAVRSLLKYCYTGEYESNDTSHMHVYALADMLDVPDLKLAAVKKLQSQLEDNWIAASFSEIVKEVYSTTNSRDKKIRDLIIKSALKHHTELCKMEEFKEVLNEFGEFSGGIVMSWGDVTLPDSRCACGKRNWGTACRDCSQWRNG